MPFGAGMTFPWHLRICGPHRIPTYPTTLSLLHQSPQHLFPKKPFTYQIPYFSSPLTSILHKTSPTSPCKFKPLSFPNSPIIAETYPSLHLYINPSSLLHFHITYTLLLPLGQKIKPPPSPLFLLLLLSSFFFCSRTSKPFKFGVVKALLFVFP